MNIMRDLCILPISLLILDTVWADTLLPPSKDGGEFSREAENFIIKRSQSDHGLMQDDPALNEALRVDARDWESTLAKMIGNPTVYGKRASGVAFNAALLRKTAKNPEIVEATQVLFEARIRSAEGIYQNYAAQGQPKHPAINSELDGTAIRMLEVGVPGHLLSIMHYLNSGADDHIGLIGEHTADKVAAALRQYGDQRHAEEAGKLARRLRDVGRSDLADDMTRSVERILKEKTESKLVGSSGDESEPGGKRGGAANTAGGKKGTDGFSWILGAAIGGLAVAIGILLKKRK